MDGVIYHDRPFGDAGTPRGAARGWDFLGDAPVPIRQRVRDGVAALVEARGRGTDGRPVKCCFPMGQGGAKPFKRLRLIRDLAGFPDLLVSADHPNAFNRDFHARNVEGGAFTDLRPERVSPVFEDADLIDPKGWIGVYAVAPFVMLIDKRRLNGLPVPRRWSDLTDPIYRDQVVFGGWRREGERRWSSYNKFLLLHLLVDLGEAGARAVLANVPTLLHSAQMPRVAGSARSPGGVMIAPWSLADMCPRRDVTEVVWPEDGALAYPLWFTVKVAVVERMGFLARWFAGPDLAPYLNDNRYPSIAAGVPSVVPVGARMRFLGWDRLRSRSTADDVKRADRLFWESRETIGERADGGS